MSLFTDIREVIDRAFEPTTLGLSALAGTTTTLANPDPWLLNSFGAAPSASGKRVSPDTAMRVAAVYACVRVLSQSIAQLPLILYRRTRDGGSEPAYDHPLYPVLANLPNPEMTSQDAREMAMNHLCLRGMAFYQIVRNQALQIIELWPLHPDFIRLRRDLVTGALVYDYTANGKSETFAFNEVWRIIGMSFDGIVGLSPIGYARESIGLSMATEEHGAKLFANGAQVATAFEHPATLSDEGYKRLKDSFDQRFAGSGNAFKSIILEGGMKVTKLSLSSAEAQYLELRGFQLIEICRIFNVPPHKIQELTRATFNNIEHLTMDFKNSSLAPFMVRFEQSGARDLLSAKERQKYFLRHDTSQLDRADTAALVNMGASGIANTWLSPDEVRAMFHMNPRPDGQGGKYENPNTSSGKTKPGEPVPDTGKG